MSKEKIIVDLSSEEGHIDAQHLWKLTKLTTHEVFRIAQEQFEVVPNPANPKHNPVVSEDGNFAFYYESSVYIDQKDENPTEITGRQSIEEIQVSALGLYMLLDYMDNDGESQNAGGAHYEHKEEYPAVYRIDGSGNTFNVHNTIVEFVRSEK